MKKVLLPTALLITVLSTANAAPIEMQLIAEGEFTMGSPANEANRQSDEVEHKVSVSAFYMSPYEVDQKLYREIMGNNPSRFQGDALPVENVSWFDAIRFCNQLSLRDGLTPVYVIDSQNAVQWNRQANGYRLPTEAEWEYAARAKTQTPFNTGENISAETEANYYGTYPYKDARSQTYRQHTVDVNTFKPNAFGLYNMHGNVWEWCWDIYSSYDLTIHSNPTGATEGISRVNRGGGWNDFGKNLRSAYRAAYNPNNATFNLGLRLVRNAK